jgi:hypothetical protein
MYPSGVKPRYQNQKLSRELAKCDLEVIEAIARINAFYQARSDAQIAAFRRQSAQRVRDVLRRQDAESTTPRVDRSPPEA